MHSLKISLIVAIDDKNGIGKNNGLLWHIPDELKHFREITTGHPIIMGRKTHQSIGKALPNRTNIVITRDKEYQAEGCVVVNSFEEAIRESVSVISSSSSSLSDLGVDDLSDLGVDDLSGLRAEGLSDSEGSAGSEHSSGDPSVIPQDDNQEIFIIGGGEIYQQAMEQGVVDKIYLTKVQGDYAATVFFPDFSQYKETKQSEIQKSNNYEYQFLELEKN